MSTASASPTRLYKGVFKYVNSLSGVKVASKTVAQFYRGRHYVCSGSKVNPLFRFIVPLGPVSAKSLSLPSIHSLPAVILECQVLVVELLLYASHRIPQTLAAIQPLVNQAQPESCQRLVIEPGHAMVLRKTFQASAHAVHRGLDIRGIQIHHDHSQMVAMMEFFFPRRQRSRRSTRVRISASVIFVAPKKNARRQLEPTGVICVHFQNSRECTGDQGSSEWQPAIRSMAVHVFPRLSDRLFTIL